MAKTVDHPSDPRPSKAAIMGHPIHPMLIPFPIALLALVPVSDIIFLAEGDVFWARTSYYMLWAGLVTAGLAAIAGLIDFVGIKRARTRRAGWLHVGANVAVIGLTVVNVSIRAGDLAGAIAPSGLILSLIGLLLLIVSGWYGGELSYRHQIGVVAPERPAAHHPEAAAPSRSAGGR